MKKHTYYFKKKNQYLNLNSKMFNKNIQLAYYMQAFKNFNLFFKSMQSYCDDTVDSLSKFK